MGRTKVFHFSPFSEKKWKEFLYSRPVSAGLQAGGLLGGLPVGLEGLVDHLVDLLILQAEEGLPEDERHAHPVALLRPVRLVRRDVVIPIELRVDDRLVDQPHQIGEAGVLLLRLDLDKGLNDLLRDLLLQLPLRIVDDGSGEEDTHSDVEGRLPLRLGVFRPLLSGRMGGGVL